MSLTFMDCEEITQDMTSCNDDLFHICYDAKENIFYDECGFINYNIYTIMTPNQVYLFKKNKKDIIIRTSAGDFYEVIYDDGTDYN